MKGRADDGAIAAATGASTLTAVAIRYGTNLKGRTRAIADAYQHAVWSYEMTRLMDAERTKKYGDAHEVSTVNSAGQQLKDLYNNNVGRRLASDPRNKGRSAHEAVLDAMKRGELRIEPFSVLGPFLEPREIP